MRYIAFVTKGLEKIAEQELVAVPALQILKVLQKFIHFEYSGDPKILQTLKTVDDVGVFLAEVDTVDTVADLVKLLPADQLQEVFRYIRGFRPLATTFSLTLSMYKNTLDREEIQAAGTKYVQDILVLEYTALDHSNFDVRITVEEKSAFVSIKLFLESLYKRSYGHITQLGSLRSTIAAAMLYKLCDGQKDLLVVDNFCGSGTFLCEAFRMGCLVSGGDKDTAAVEITKQNLEKAGVLQSEVVVEDALQTKWQTGTFDIAVANFPWDKQIEVKNFSELFDGAIREYARTLKVSGKFGFISTKPELVLKYVKKYLQIENVEEYKIGYLGQTPTIQLFSVSAQ